MTIQRLRKNVVKEPNAFRHSSQFSGMPFSNSPPDYCYAGKALPQMVTTYSSRRLRAENKKLAHRRVFLSVQYGTIRRNKLPNRRYRQCAYHQ